MRPRCDLYLSPVGINRSRVHKGGNQNSENSCRTRVRTGRRKHNMRARRQWRKISSTRNEGIDHGQRSEFYTKNHRGRKRMDREEIFADGENGSTTETAKRPAVVPPNAGCSNGSSRIRNRTAPRRIYSRRKRVDTEDPYSKQRRQQQDDDGLDDGRRSTECRQPTLGGGESCLNLKKDWKGGTRISRERFKIGKEKHEVPVDGLPWRRDSCYPPHLGYLLPVVLGRTNLGAPPQLVWLWREPSLTSN
jgi:hypothetical protein